MTWDNDVVFSVMTYIFQQIKYIRKGLIMVKIVVEMKDCRYGAYFCAFGPKLNIPKMQKLNEKVQKLNLKIEKLPNVANYMQVTLDHC